MLSRNNIAYNLYKTPHKTSRKYNGYDVVFFFSSELYLNKFESRCNDNRNKISASLSNRFGFQIDANLISDIKLYSSIEKRGFLMSSNGEYIECLEKLIISDGVNQIIKNSIE